MKVIGDNFAQILQGYVAFIGATISNEAVMENGITIDLSAPKSFKN